jgi:serine protease AprX
MFCILFLSALNYAGAYGAKSRISADAKAAEPGSTVQVVIQWKVPASPARQKKIADLTGTVLGEFSSTNAGVYRLPAAALATLENDADVTYVSIDRKVKHKLDLTAAAVNAQAAWGAGLTGSGIGVALIDSGVNANTNLANPMYFQDFTGARPAQAGVDQFGHGEHVAGIIASTAASQASTDTRIFKGIAPGVSLINLRALDLNGEGSDSGIIAAIDQAIALKQTYNIRVMNLSLGRPVFESYKLDPLCQAVEAAWKAGIVVVVAAGNDGRDNSFGTSGYGTIEAPGNDPYVITVGAMKTEGTASRTDDLIASYSSKGPTQVDHIVKPDIIAPGNRVVSLNANRRATLFASYPANQVQTSYFVNMRAPGAFQGDFFLLSGTSMAAPVVSGAVADLLQARPSLTPDQVKILLMQTASKSFPTSSTVVDNASGQSFTSYYDIFTVGAGYLDLGAAVAAIGNLPAVGTALSPVANYNASLGTVTVAFDPSSAFNYRSAWGAQSVWGLSVLNNANQAVWGTQSVWGLSGANSTRSVWGVKAVWGICSIWSAGSTSSSETLPVSITGEQ